MKQQLYKGVILIVLSAVCVAVGQYLWKLSANQFYLAIIGFVFYAVGALLMIVGFRYGEVSVLHPMLSVSFVLALFIGSSPLMSLNETIKPTMIIGVVVIFLGMVFLGLASKGEKHD